MHQLQAIKSKPAHQPGARRDARPLVAPVSEHDRWMELQRGIGNQAVGRLLQRHVRPGSPAAGASNMTGECEEYRKGKTVGLQTKLRINEPGDAYEQEADRVAEQLLAKPAHPDVSSAPPRIQRYPGQSSAHMGAAPASVDRALGNPGWPLEPVLRQDMEQRFGHDFSKVRVHSDAAAEQSAREANAHAYTVGNHIVFDVGKFATHDRAGRLLLAHELTHVVQQSAGAVAVQRQPQAPAPSVDEARAAAIVEAEEGSATTAELEAQSDAEDALKLKWSRRKDKTYAWALGLKDRDRLQKTLDLSPAFQQELTVKIGFFSGEAKAAYIQTISPALADFPGEKVIAILSGRAFGTHPGIGVQDIPCDISKKQFLLQYEDEPDKARCMDLTTDAEFERDYFENNIVPPAVGYAVKGTTWQNVEYDSFKIMLVNYENDRKDYFVLDDLGNFHTSDPTASIERKKAWPTLDYTYIKRKNGLIYPAYRNRVYFNEVLTPNLLSLKKGLQYQVEELKDLYTLLQHAGAYASILGMNAAAAGTFETSINAFRRGPAKLPGRPLPGIGVRTTGKTSSQTTELGGVPEPISEEAPTARMSAAEQRASGGEIVGGFRVVGTKTLNGKTFERYITGLYGESGKQTDIRPIKDLANQFMEEARAAGATELKITGDIIVNDNVLRIQRFAQLYGGTSRKISNTMIEIIIPIR